MRIDQKKKMAVGQLNILKKIEIDSEANDQGVNYSDIEIFSEPVRDQHNDSREKRNLRRNARRNLPC